MNSKIKRLCECSIMIALASVLSLLKVADFPYGGSVTLASMLPIVLIAYRHGTLTGLACGLVYGVVQQLLGLNTLSYASTPAAVIAIILLDYLLAFGVIGLAGLFRNMKTSASLRLASGALFACLARYILHVIAGATVWAGLSIPTEAALFYSLGYNATYMIPETIVLVCVLSYLASVIDFRADIPTPVRRERSGAGSGLLLGAWFSAILTVVLPTAMIFPAMQNADTGAFDVGGLFSFDFTVPLVLAALFLVLTLVLFLAARYADRAQDKNSANG